MYISFILSPLNELEFKLFIVNNSMVRNNPYKYLRLHCAPMFRVSNKSIGALSFCALVIIAPISVWNLSISSKT